MQTLEEFQKLLKIPTYQEMGKWDREDEINISLNIPFKIF